MLLFWIVFELLPVPVLVILIVLLPEPIPTSVPAVAVKVVPTTFRFLIVSLVAPSAPLLCSHTTADEVPAFVLVIVKLRSVPVPPMEPSRVMRSAAFRRTNAPENDPVIARAAPVG